jgi:hypothetical protein
VKGFNWEKRRHAWSKDGKKFSVFELEHHLQGMIKEEKKYSIPLE